MLEQFLHHIERNNLCKKTDKILLTVSGGVDSMVMLHLFKEAGFNIGVAHCNFQLRDEESKGDEVLVNMTCLDAGLPFHCEHFDTLSYATAKGISIQMAARELRYQFFKALAHENGYGYIATAHHLNDNIETVLLNLTRGTGMDGIIGIPVNHHNIIRPLLFASREMITHYASFNRITWREDSSNASDKYHRNMIRNQVLPLLKKINPNLEQSFKNSLERLRGSAALAQVSLQQFINEAVTETEGGLRIDRKKISNNISSAVILWELIKDKGFNYIQCREIVESNHQTGKVFYSQTNQLTIDRDHFVISILTSVPEVDVVIEDDLTAVKRANQMLTFELVDRSDFSMVKDSAIAQFDYNKLSFPITWRRWAPGDRFVPLGMEHQKKLSDFFVDLKISLPDKDSITVLESAGEIVWVVGYRISDRFKVTEITSQVLCVGLHKS